MVSEGTIFDESYRKNFLIEVAKGNVPGHFLVHKFGRNDGLPNGSFEFVTLLGQTAHKLSASTTMRIKAGNVNDTFNGFGAREITIQGIDSSFNEIIETIVTNGASASLPTTNSFWRVHRAWVSNVGTYGAANTGAITIENSAGNTDIVMIAANEGQTQDACWTVPIRKTAYLLSVHMTVTVEVNKPSDIMIFTRNDIDLNVTSMKSKRIKKCFEGIQGSHTYKPESADISINEKSDIWAEAQGSGVGAKVSVDFELLVVDNK